ncbi:transmembrane protein, putative (macronuclear) [Tetrahymena thermophila SB210]|uniref:Transmembrane protein, putative n=1 Tax=Tetrahymena thermophila (strain SB210) TaxID=312017 RepID=Q22DP4_TETTS|nr:transmembrane protein, putative [Tetrahymena thermophila SB210]EAR83410.2 transmembrane protein, putative [Tetrahymena thermophila SB210]|eukprot:XP_001031073.2 transmembrane protein, putative [Tetrahymena thermophila SB210]
MQVNCQNNIDIFNLFFIQQGLTYIATICSPNCIYQLNSFQQLFNFIPGCSEYLDSTKQSCKVCNPNYQLSNRICIVTCGLGYFEKDGICIQCDQSCQTCNGTLPTNCLICQDGLYFHQDNLCKVCDTNNGYMIDSQSCICQDGYKLDNQKCVQLYLSYNSGTFSQSVVTQVTQQAQTSSKAAFASTTFLSSVQNLISTSSIGISINGITCFKLSYLLLVNTVLPQQIYGPLSAIKDQCPSSQFQKLNLFALINQNSSEYQNLRYQQLDISYNILQTSGQALQKMKELNLS